MSITGPADGEPHKVGVAIVDVTAGLFAANAILAALHYRGETGKGQYIDIALLDSQIGWLVNVAQNYLANHETPGRYGNAHPNIVPYETFRTADGILALAIGTDAQFQRFCEVIGHPELSADPSYKTNPDRVIAREDLVPRLQDLFLTRTTADWIDLLLAEKIPVAPVNDIPTILNDPQTKAREMVQTIKRSTGETLSLIGPVAKLSKTPAKIKYAPPRLGQDTAEVLGQHLQYSSQLIEQLKNEGVI